MARPIVDLLHQQFDDLTVIELTDERTSSGEPYWRLRCACGDTTGKATGASLRRGRRNFCPKCTEAASKLSPFKTLYGNYKRNAEIRGLPFNLSLPQFVQMVQKPCFYCDLPPAQWLKKPGAAHGVTYNGIDRVVNTEGYSLSNAVPCCKYCNLAKSTFPVDEFLTWLKHLKNSR